MDYNLYQEQTLHFARQQLRLLEETAQKMEEGKPISPLEWNGIEHTFQVLIENAIGKGKHLLKMRELDVPVSAYDVFHTLAEHNLIDTEEMDNWNKAIGLRNAIVHEYFKIDRSRLKELCISKDYVFITEFLEKSFFDF